METTAALFVPPRCPRSWCPFHTSTEGWRWIRFGCYRRQREPRVLPRFRCCHCGSTFSSNAFTPRYYLKRPELLLTIAQRLLACSGYRQIARELGCAPSTVMGQAARIGRHAMLVLEELGPKGQVPEPLVIDGFESFAYSQYHPLYLNLVVGADSHYVYAFTHSRLRRKGTMRPGQKKRRAAIEAEHGPAHPKAIELGTAEALRLAAPEPQAMTVRSDEHMAYPRALRRLVGYTIRHEMTPSVQARTSDNPLFPVNLADLLFRHNSACHKRETIAFSKRHQSVIERGALLVMWMNFTKKFSENFGRGTRGIRRGLCETVLSFRALFRERRFPDVVGLRGSWPGYYRREVDTPGIANPRRHALKLAF